MVQKYGGSSVADTERVRRVAQRVASARRRDEDVVVVVSAMGTTTDQLIAQAREITPEPPGRELDMLLTAGERISMSAARDGPSPRRGLTARSFTGSQAGIITDAVHGRARILDITPGRIREALAGGHVVIVAGFQGVSRESKDVTTLGRGGSDTTAVALAAALGARVCEIYTDVRRRLHRRSADRRRRAAAGTTCPTRRCWSWRPAARRSCRCAASSYARNHGVAVHVRSSFTLHRWHLGRRQGGPRGERADLGRRARHGRGQARHPQGAGNRPGIAARTFQALADAHINVDMIVQNVSADGTTDISCTVPADDGPRALALLEGLRTELEYDEGGARPRVSAR